METVEFDQNPLKGAPEDFSTRIEGIRDVESHEKELLKHFVGNVFYGDPDLRIYNLEGFLEQVGEEKAIELQRKFVAELTERERNQLVERIPKGTKVELEVEKYWNGNSPHAKAQMKGLIERFGLFAPNEGESLPDDIEIESRMKLSEDEAEWFMANSTQLSDEEAKEFVEEVFPEGEKTRNIVRGTVQAEPIQGYGGMRLITEDGEMIGEGTEDVVGFVLTGVDKEQAKRRPREIYHDRRVRVLEPYTNTWREGTIDDKLFADQIRVNLTEPVSKKSILNIERSVEFIDAWIGKPPDYEPTEELPEIGSSSIETEPWMYETIQFDLEANGATIEKVPEVFRPGNLISFQDEIFEVGRVSSQGAVEMREIGRPPDLIDWNIANWTEIEDLPHSLTDEGLPPEIVVAAKNITGSRVRVNTRDLGYQGGKEVITAVNGVYNIDGSPKVLLQALPVWQGRHGNKPDFSYKAVGWSDFNRLREEGTIEVSDPDITRELRERFPRRFEDILKLLDKTGSVSCNLLTKDGRTDKGSVSLSSLPYGVWKVWEPGGKPELIPLEDIEDIEAYDFWAQFK